MEVSLFNLIRSCLTVAMLWLCAPPSADATNGYFTHGTGTRAKGMAGAGLAAVDNVTAIDTANNPALGVFARPALEMGLGLFSPRRRYATGPSDLDGQFGAFSLAPGSSDSERNWFPVPWIANAWKTGPNSAWSVAFYGRGGMNTQWPIEDSQARFDAGSGIQAYDGAYGAGTAGVDLMQAFLSVGYARRVGSRFSIGIAPMLAAQTFEARGLGSSAPYTFAPVTRTFVQGAFPRHLSDNGHDTSFGWGAQAGLWWQPSDRLNIGVAATSKMHMTRFEQYADLFAGRGDFDIPASVRVGLSVRATARLTVNIDAEKIFYEQVGSVSNPATNLLNCPSAGGSDVQSCLGGKRGAGFGWQNMRVFKLGAEWRTDGAGTWRAGYSYGTQPLQKQDVLFNVLAPGVMQEHWTIGASFDARDGGSFSVAFMYAPESSVRGANFLDPTQQIELAMRQFEIEFSYTWD